MKVGDQIAFSLEGHQVGYATIEDISDGKATIAIPATRVVMGIKSSLTVPAPEVDRAFGGLVETRDNTPSEAVQEVNAEPVQTTFANAAPEPGSMRGQNLDSSILD